jgi:hypothetical protein
VLALRLASTAAVLVLLVWLLRDGQPLALLFVPLAAIALRRAAETGRLHRLVVRR